MFLFLVFRLSFPLNNSVTIEPFEVIHCDIWGPFSTSTLGVFRYFLIIVDDFTQPTWFYMMKNKQETRPKLLSFLLLLKYNLIIKSKPFEVTMA